MRWYATIIASAALVAAANPAGAQERFKVSVNVGGQATSEGFAEEQNLQQYLEEGSFTFERTLTQGGLL